MGKRVTPQTAPAAHCGIGLAASAALDVRSLCGNVQLWALPELVRFLLHAGLGRIRGA